MRGPQKRVYQCLASTTHQLVLQAVVEREGGREGVRGGGSGVGKGKGVQLLCGSVGVGVGREVGSYLADGVGLRKGV